MQVNLYTAAGDFVAEVEIPPFNRMPEILVWGERHFIWHEDPASVIDGKVGYVEAFAFWVPA